VQTTLSEKSTRRERWAWYLYDFGNSATVRIGKPFGPFHAKGRGRARRRQLEAIGHEIMQRIAELIPPERRGHYSDDPAIRAAAQGSEIYPWADAPEG